MTDSEMAVLSTKFEYLKEFFTEKIDSLDERLTERFDNAKEALKIQAQEYERRLTILNGEAERLQRMQDTYVAKAVYDIQHSELSKQVNSLNETRAHNQGQQAVIAVIVSAAFGIVVTLINYFLTKNGK